MKFSSNRDRSGQYNAFQGLLPRGNLQNSCNINKSESAQVHRAKEAKVLWKWLQYNRKYKISPPQDKHRRKQRGIDQ